MRAPKAIRDGRLVLLKYPHKKAIAVGYIDKKVIMDKLQEPRYSPEMFGHSPLYYNLSLTSRDLRAIAKAMDKEH